MLHFEVLFHYSVSRIWDVVHDNVEVHLVRFVAVSVEALAHFYAVRVVQHLQDS